MSSENRPGRRLRLLTAIAALLAAAALVAAGCGGDEEETTTSSESTETTESTESTSTEASSGTVEGNGYSYALPDEWSLEQESAGTESGVDTVILSDDSSGKFRVNVNVVRETGVPDDIAIGDYVDSGLDQVKEDPASFGLPGDATVELVGERSETDLAGDSALDYEVLTKGEGIAASQRQIAAIHDGVAYTITLSAGEGELEPSSPVLDGIVSSWGWS